jgi:pectin methylesterase-like acyl-CoA thioesterase
MRRLWLVIAVLLAVAGLPGLTVLTGMASGTALAAPGPAHHARPRALLVCNDSTVPCPALRRGQHEYATIQAAVNAARHQLRARLLGHERGRPPGHPRLADHAAPVR